MIVAQAESQRLYLTKRKGQKKSRAGNPTLNKLT